MPGRNNQPSPEEVAALKKELRIITATAEKQLSEMQRVVGFLRDSNDYHLFEQWFLWANIMLDIGEFKYEPDISLLVC